MARITYAKIRKGSIRELGLKAVIDGVAAGNSYDDICNAINVACFAGEDLARARRRYTWAFVKCSNEDGTDVCPPPAKSAMTKPEVAALVRRMEDEVQAKTEEIVVSADQILADLEAEIEALGPVGNVAADKTVDHSVGA